MSIPLRAKVSIRDQWDNPDGSVQVAIAQLKQSLGLGLQCDPQWSILIAELDAVYKDKGELINYITSSVFTWVSVLSGLIDNEAHEEWAEMVVEKVKELGRDARLTVEIARKSEPATEWSENRGGFVLLLPKDEVHHAGRFAPVFQEQLLTCFEAKKTKLPIQSTTGDEWADVGVEDASETVVAKSARPLAHAAANVEYLPDPDTLPRPSTLMLKPPYHLFIKVGSNERNHANTKLELQCSHPPTLDFLTKYLKKWCSITPGHPDKSPVVTFKLNQGQTGFGLPYDTLDMVSEYRYAGIFTISAPLILNLVESVLGYERVFEDVNSWQYRRDAPYRT